MAFSWESLGGPSQLLLDFLSKHQVVSTLLTLTAVLAVLISFFSASSSNHRHGTTLQPPSVPGCWLPLVRHCPQFLFNRAGFLAGLTKRYPDGIFSLILMGRTNHIIHSPALASTLWNRPRSVDEKWLAARMLTASFGLRRQDQTTYSKLAHETPDLFKHMLSDPGLSSLVSAMIDQVKAHISELVTFSSSAADQTDWERAAGADLVNGSKGETFVEADLMLLVRNFVARTANPALFGTDFVENFPEFWHLLWILDEGLVLLAAKLPGWIPWPRLRRARAARRQMLMRTREFEAAMDKHLRGEDGEDAGNRWQDMENVSTFVKSRIQLFRNHGLSLEARASCDVALAWAMNANANPLITWLLFELYRDAVLLEAIRQEVAPFVKVAQPENGFGSAVWVAPELVHLDVEGLIHKCPQLKAAYLETLRVYTGIWAVRCLTEDVVLETRSKRAEGYLLQKGDMVHMAHELHQFDANFFPNPNEWHHERFLKQRKDDVGRSVQTVELGTLRPYGRFLLPAAMKGGFCSVD